MSNAWLILNRATLSACARQPAHRPTSIRAFAAQPWRSCTSTANSSLDSSRHDRASAARCFQWASRRRFSSGAAACGRGGSPHTKKQRPFTHAKAWTASENTPQSQDDPSMEAAHADSAPPGSPSQAPDPNAALPDPRHYSLPDQPYDQAQIDQIFGADSGVRARKGNYILAVLHQRRLTGSIAEDGISEPADAGGIWSRPAAAQALQWLRLKHPVDEEATTAQWAEEEARRIELEYYTQKGLSWGLIKKSAEPQGGSATTVVIDPYAGGALGGLTKEIKRQRAVNEKKLDAERERQEQERVKVQERLLRERTQQQGRTPAVRAGRTPGYRLSPKATGARQLQKDHISDEELQEWGGYATEQQWSRQYRLQVAQTAAEEPPKMTKFQRLFAPTLFTAFVVVGCVLLSLYYQPFPEELRLFPFVAPAIATCGALMALKVIVLFAWRYPPFWATMNKYCMLAPGYPYAASILGNVFAHQDFTHIASTLLFLATGGVLAHELLGRGDFFAVYLGAGAVGSWFSLAARVGTGSLYTMTCGSSAAICGLISASALLTPDRTWTLRIPWTETTFSVWTVVVLQAFVLADVVGAFAQRSRLDHLAHLGGYGAGAVAALLLARRFKDRARDAEQRRRGGGIGGNVMWRQDDVLPKQGR